MTQVRLAEAGDLDAVADLDWRALHEPFMAAGRLEERRAALMAVWPGFMGEPDKRLYVIARAGRVAGFAAVRLVVGEAELDAIAVEPDARRAGLGRALLGEVLDALAGEGTRRIALEVRAGNAAARALYARFGFAEEGRRRSYYENGDDAILYGRALP